MPITNPPSASDITNVPSGNLSSTDVQGALNELQSDVDTRLTGANISDTAYNATSWDGVTTIAPSKNAVRDKIETLDAKFLNYVSILGSETVVGSKIYDMDLAAFGRGGSAGPSSSLAVLGMDLSLVNNAFSYYFAFDSDAANTGTKIFQFPYRSLTVNKGTDIDSTGATSGKVLTSNGGVTSSWSTLAGSAITNTPAGGISSVTVQAAINELDTEKANLASPTFTGTPSLPTGTTGITQAAGNSTTALATTAFVTTGANAILGSYSTLMECSGSHTAAKVAGTYALGDGDPIAVSGTGTLYPIKTIFIAAADYPTINGLAPKLRIRAQLYTNDVAPTGNFTFGLYPITRPATSGGAGLAIYTLGTVVSGSNGATFTTPAADGLLNAVGADFALPADGHYVIGVVTTATVATSAHLHMVSSLQMRNA
jgi:hypothetical protein